MSAAMPILKSIRLESKTRSCEARKRRSACRTFDQQHRENAVKSSTESTDFIVDSCSQSTFLGKTQISVPTQLAEERETIGAPHFQSKSSTSRDSNSGSIRKTCLEHPCSDQESPVYMRNAQYENFSDGNDAIFLEVVLIKVQG